jgi:undecaprenyl diphosphate synthase
MDGNGRWAAKRGLPRTVGHLAGLKSLRKVLLGSIKHHIPYVTLYCFSTENWARPAAEVNYLMALFAEKISGELAFFNENGIKVLCTGAISTLPDTVKKSISMTEDETENNLTLTLQLAINYGGQDEICQAANRAIKDGVTQLTPTILRSYFSHPAVPPVDMIARSAGEKRLSNFLLFDSAYAELGFYEELWPDWDENMIEKITIDYDNRERRFGGLGK